MELLRPLSKAALAIVEAQPCLGDYVFSARGQGLATFGRSLKTFYQRCGVSGWRPHDLRRTARTLLSRAGVSPDIAERCLGHAIPGVRKIYDRHGFKTEMAQAYEALAALIQNIVTPSPANVVPLRR